MLPKSVIPTGVPRSSRHRPNCHPDRSNGAFCRCGVEGSWQYHRVLALSPFFEFRFSIFASSLFSAFSVLFLLPFSVNSVFLSL